MVKKSTAPADSAPAADSAAAPADSAPAPAATATAASTDASAKPKREMKGDHEFLNANGDVVKTIEEATGIRYTDKTAATPEVFSFQIPGASAGNVATMFAIFGAKTRATNAASAARQARDRDPAVTTSDVAWIMETFAETRDGQWTAPTTGVKREPKYDLDALAAVIAESLERAGKGAASEKLPLVRAKLGGDVAYRNGALKNPDILKAYMERIGGGTSIDNLDV